MARYLGLAGCARLQEGDGSEQYLSVPGLAVTHTGVLLLFNASSHMDDVRRKLPQVRVLSTRAPAADFSHVGCQRGICGRFAMPPQCCSPFTIAHIPSRQRLRRRFDIICRLAQGSVVLDCFTVIGPPLPIAASAAEEHIAEVLRR